ncbi:hypothetical protein Tco_0182050, partial [Tanacetum coccineum]
IHSAYVSLSALEHPSYPLGSKRICPNFAEVGCSSGPETIAHSTRIILLPFSVSIPPMTGNFIISYAVDGTAYIFRNPGLPMIPLCGDVDLTTMKSIHADVECSSSPIFTKSVICPNGHFISPLNPTKGIKICPDKVDAVLSLQSPKCLKDV